MNLASEKKPTTSQPQIFGETDFFGLTLYKRGNRKDLYDLGENLLVVTKDRIASAPAATTEQTPGIGRVVNQFSTHWFKQLEKLTPKHFISADINQFPDACQAYAEQLEGRSMLVKKMTPLPASAVPR